MKTWVQLTPDQAHFHYRVPLNVARTNGNVFYGTISHPGSTRFDDGPWPFWALLKNPARPELLDLRVCTVELEALDFEGFNPLNEKGSYLYLSKKEILGFSSLLLNYASGLISSQKDVHRTTFRKLKKSELAGFGLFTEWFDRVGYYLQFSIDPAEKTLDTTTTIVGFSPKKRPTRHLSIAFQHFNLESLHDSSFNMLDDSLGRILLDKHGMEELAKLLETQTEDLLDV